MLLYAVRLRVRQRAVAEIGADKNGRCHRSFPWKHRRSDPGGTVAAKHSAVDPDIVYGYVLWDAGLVDGCTATRRPDRSGLAVHAQLVESIDGDQSEGFLEPPTARRSR